jgi:hypothetical protein
MSGLGVTVPGAGRSDVEPPSGLLLAGHAAVAAAPRGARPHGVPTRLQWIRDKDTPGRLRAQQDRRTSGSLALRVVEEARPPTLADLSDADLVGLRLAAQVLAHKAELARRAPVVAYFAGLELAAQNELASRATGIRVVTRDGVPTLQQQADDEDRQLLDDYLALLAGNEQLSPPMRAVCEALRRGHDR